MSDPRPLDGATERNTGARSNPSTEVPSSLAVIGLTRDQSSRYLQLAAMPDEHFETTVATASVRAYAGTA